MISMIDPESVASYIRETARAVILPRFRALGQDDVREKKPGDPVTVADTEAEQELTRRLRTIIPGAHVLGEESVAEDAARLSWLSSEARRVIEYLLSPLLRYKQESMRER